MNLYGPVRADETTGKGDAAVKLSLEWKGVPVAATSHTLRVVEPAGGKPLPVSGRLVRSLPHPDRTASLWGVRFTPQGRLFTSGYPSGVVQIWDVAKGSELRRVETPRGYRGSADYALVSADFRALYVPIDRRKVTRLDDLKKRFRIEYNSEVLAWDLTTGKALPSLRPREGRGVISAYLSPDGKRLVTVERAGHLGGEQPPPDVVRLYDTATGKGRPLGEGYGQAVFSPDSRRVYVTFTTYTGQQTSALKVFDTDGKEQATLAGGTKPVPGSQGMGTPVLSPDGKRLAVLAGKSRINESGSIKVFDLATNKEVADFASGGAFPFMLPVFSPDGRRLAAGDYDGQVRVWDVARRALVRKHRFEGKSLGFHAAFSPDGKWLAVPARVKTEDRSRDPDPLDFPQPRVYLFDLTKGDDPEELVCPHGWSGGVAFAADGKTLAVGGAGAVHLFDVSKPAPGSK